MKRIILLIIAALMLAGCGLDSIPQDGLTSAIGGQNTTAGIGVDRAMTDTPDIVGEVTNINCNGMTISGTNHAQISFRFEPPEGSMMWNSMGPIPMYGGGLVEIPKIKEPFTESLPFSCEGAGDVRAIQIQKGDGASFGDWLIELQATQLTTQIDGIKIDSENVRIVGVASTEGAKELNVPSSDEKESNPLEILHCEGMLIPNSSLANITFVGKLKDGQQIVGGGLLDTNMMPLADMCNEVSAEGVVYEIEVTDHIKLGDIKGEFKLGIIRDGASGLPIFQGVVVNHEEQYS